MKRLFAMKFGEISKLVLFMVLTLICSIVLGGEHEGAAHEGGIPQIVFYQAINFFGVVLLLFFIGRKKVSGFFNKRYEALAGAVREAKLLKEAAEKKHEEYTVKIQNLNRESEKILQQIRADGEETRRKIIEEAQRVAAAIQVEAQRAAANEIERAKVHLYEEVLQQALDGAHVLLTKSIAEGDQKRLQKEFVEKIEAVQ